MRPDREPPLSDPGKRQREWMTAGSFGCDRAQAAFPVLRGEPAEKEKTSKRARTRATFVRARASAAVTVFLRRIGRVHERPAGYRPVLRGRRHDRTA
jgi:hypothetical protein